MKFNSSINQFRTVAILEGISYLLLGFTMYLKYAAEMPLPNKIVGYAHGLLFIAYVILLYLNMDDKKWNVKIVFLLFLASLLPFGTFLADKWFIKKQEETFSN
ncbi:MAG: DUF3817 domain-containing protein [Crocinitomicaceae bacterium]